MPLYRMTKRRKLIHRRKGKVSIRRKYKSKKRRIIGGDDRFTHLKSVFEQGGYDTIIELGETPPGVLINKVKSKYNPAKKLAVFYHNDYNDDIDIPSDVLLFRAGMIKSKRKPNEYIFPVYWMVTPHLEPLQKSEKPCVSFCGSLASHPIRQVYLDKMQNNTLLKTNFIRRSAFWNGKPGDKQTIDEFNENLKSSEFTFCPRGTGNFSMRFYETLKAGRIPVIINEELVMPFKDGLIDWPSICVIVNPDEDISQKIYDFWKNNDIYEVQKKCANTYNEYMAAGKAEQNLYDQIK